MQGSGQPGPALHERFARAIAKTVMAPGFVIARPRRGRGNLAVPCRISGKPRRKRDRLREIATSAVGLLAMTNLGAIAFLILARTSRRCSAGSGCPLPYNTACGRQWLVRAATAFPRLPRRFAPRNDKPLAFTVLSIACTGRQHCAGHGCPLPTTHGRRPAYFSFFIFQFSGFISMRPLPYNAFPAALRKIPRSAFHVFFHKFSLSCA